MHMHDMLMCMEPKEAVEALIAAGWTEHRLAEQVGCKQPTINRIRRGAVRDCMYSLGKRLVGLAESHSIDRAEACGQQPATPAPSAAKQRAA